MTWLISYKWLVLVCNIHFVMWKLVKNVLNHYFISLTICNDIYGDSLAFHWRITITNIEVIVILFLYFHTFVVQKCPLLGIVQTLCVILSLSVWLYMFPYTFSIVFTFKLWIEMMKWIYFKFVYSTYVVYWNFIIYCRMLAIVI